MLRKVIWFDLDLDSYGHSLWVVTHLGDHYAWVLTWNFRARNVKD